jgi:hypothetical protein
MTSRPVITANPAVDLWIAIGSQGQGAIAVTRQDALSRVSGSPYVVVGKVSVWALVSAMFRYTFLGPSALPVSFRLEHCDGGYPVPAERRRRW